MIQAREDQDLNLAQVDQDANGGAYSKIFYLLSQNCT
jgi:hypothetical protein